MLRSAKSIMGFQLECLDSALGAVKDLYFHDGVWAIRYVVADPMPFLPGRKVLIPPAEMQQPDWHARAIPVNLTRDQVRNSPPHRDGQACIATRGSRVASFLPMGTVLGPGGNGKPTLGRACRE